MFLGTYQNKIDDKNRMAVPAKFRDQLGGRCVLTKGFDECLYIYTMKDFEEMAAKIAALPQSDADFREFSSDFFGYSELCELDAQGRIKIPQSLRDYARITKDLITIGNGDKVAIWSVEAKSDFDMAKKMKDRKFTDKLREYGI